MADETPKVELTDDRKVVVSEQKEVKLFLPIVLDTSVLFSFVCDSDPHHLSVESALGAIKPHKPELCVPAVVLLEVMARLIRQEKLTVLEAEKRLSKKLHEHDIRYETAKVDYKSILGRYRAYAKSDVSKLKGVDFYIVVEAMGIGGLLLTCDKEMYDKARKSHHQTFLLGAGQSINRIIKTVEKISTERKKETS